MQLDECNLEQPSWGWEVHLENKPTHLLGLKIYWVHLFAVLHCFEVVELAIVCKQSGLLLISCCQQIQDAVYTILSLCLEDALLQTTPVSHWSVLKIAASLPISDIRFQPLTSMIENL